MTEFQWKELSKYFWDSGNRKLSKEEKETIKLAIDQANNLNELLQVAFVSLAIDCTQMIIANLWCWVQFGYTSFETI